METILGLIVLFGIAGAWSFLRKFTKAPKQIQQNSWEQFEEKLREIRIEKNQMTKFEKYQCKAGKSLEELHMTKRPISLSISSPGPFQEALITNVKQLLQKNLFPSNNLEQIQHQNQGLEKFGLQLQNKNKALRRVIQFLQQYFQVILHKVRTEIAQVENIFSLYFNQPITIYSTKEFIKKLIHSHPLTLKKYIKGVSVEEAQKIVQKLSQKLEYLDLVDLEASEFIPIKFTLFFLKNYLNHKHLEVDSIFAINYLRKAKIQPLDTETILFSYNHQHLMKLKIRERGLLIYGPLKTKKCAIFTLAHLVYLKTDVTQSDRNLIQDLKKYCRA